jgi:hypothetical protein
MGHKVKNGICISLFMGVFILNAQSVRLVTQDQINPAANNPVEVSFNPVFPRFVQTENAEQDEVRFLEMVKNWNAEVKDLVIGSNEMSQIRRGELTEKEFRTKHQNIDNSERKEKVPMSMAQSVLMESRLGKLWSYPELPAAPAEGSSIESFRKWIDTCYQWISENPEAQAYLKGITEQSSELTK